MIWTEDENAIRSVNLMINPKGKSCKNCHWSGYEKGDEFITCGHLHENFKSNSLCGYHTNSNDPKLIAYQDRRRKELSLKNIH